MKALSNVGKVCVGAKSMSDYSEPIHTPTCKHGIMRIQYDNHTVFQMKHIRFQVSGTNHCIFLLKQNFTVDCTLYQSPFLFINRTMTETHLYFLQILNPLLHRQWHLYEFHACSFFNRSLRSRGTVS